MHTVTFIFVIKSNPHNKANVFLYYSLPDYLGFSVKATKKMKFFFALSLYSV